MDIPQVLLLLFGNRTLSLRIFWGVRRDVEIALNWTEERARERRIDSPSHGAASAVATPSVRQVADAADLTERAGAGRR